MDLLTPQREFVSRLLVDAEAEAAAGRFDHALVLLRWASRISPEPLVPLVLLSHHRIRGSRRPHSPTPANDAAPPGVDASGDKDRDVFGFPRPRFPTRPPALDDQAFVPAPTRTPLVRRPTHVDGTGTNVRRRDVAVIVTLAVAIAAASVALGSESFKRRAAGDQNDLAGEQLAAGRPDLALATTGALPQRLPETHLLRAEAYMRLADSAAAAASLDSAAAHPRATLAELRGAAQGLLMLNRAGAAADAYTRALAAGLPRGEWAAVAEMLDRAGRADQARRLRDLAGADVRQ